MARIAYYIMVPAAAFLAAQASATGLETHVNQPIPYEAPAPALPEDQQPTDNPMMAIVPEGVLIDRRTLFGVGDYLPPGNPGKMRGAGPFNSRLVRIKQA
ncbi:MAG: hypothetical protein V1735_05850 [Nanoarchaeota archaeon]